MKSMNFSHLTLLLSFFTLAAVQAEPVNYRMAYVGDKNNTAYLGAKQGLDEANRQGQFLNQNYTLDAISVQDALNADYSGFIAVIAALDHSAYLKLVEKLPGMTGFNVSLEDDDLRTACLPNALHIYPGKQMKTDAVAQWHQLHPEANVSAQTWHPDFVKFAARDLNKRYSKTHDTPMDDAAWAGWAAMKMTSDTIAREKISESGKMLEYLKNDLVFDGQMGIEMNFRQTGQLRQPLLLIEAGKIVGEAPVRGVANPPTVDSLGNVECAK